jgi:hypothetical protein
VSTDPAPTAGPSVAGRSSDVELPTPIAPVAYPAALPTLADLRERVVAIGSQLLSEHVVSGDSSIPVELPDATHDIGIMFVCESDDSTWDIRIDDARWVRAVCAQGGGAISAVFQITESDQGKVIFKLTSENNDSLFLVTYRS